MFYKISKCFKFIDIKTIYITIPKMDFNSFVGPHPLAPHPCGNGFSALDGHTAHNIPHRRLNSGFVTQAALVDEFSGWIVNHHISPENIERDRRRREALTRQGLVDPTQRFPKADKTRKGNWAEILLAEYVKAAGSLTLPVYRLRYNPNVNQSMKGDDMLAFDFSSTPVKVLIGESKFRSSSKTNVVKEIIESLEKSHSGSVPASLQFVADILFESGNEELGNRVAECNVLFAQQQLQLNYVGLLVSDNRAHDHTYSAGESNLQGLALLSLVLDDPNQTVVECFVKASAKV